MWIVGHKIMLELTKKLLPLWLALMVPEEGHREGQVINDIAKPQVMNLNATILSIQAGCAH